MDFTQPRCVEMGRRLRIHAGKMACRMTVGKWRCSTYLSWGGGAGDTGHEVWGSGTSCTSRLLEAARNPGSPRCTEWLQPEHFTLICFQAIHLWAGSL